MYLENPCVAHERPRTSKLLGYKLDVISGLAWGYSQLCCTYVWTIGTCRGHSQASGFSAAKMTSFTKHNKYRRSAISILQNMVFHHNNNQDTSQSQQGTYMVDHHAKVAVIP
jgi:hypothetical protein